MQAADELLTLAELAIALAGFSGVVVAFANQGALSEVDRWRFAGLLSLALGAAVAAFFPSLFTLVGMSETAVWRASSGAFLVAAVPYVAVFPPRLMQISRRHGTVPPKAFIATAFALSALNLILQALNTLAWPFAPGPAPFVLGVLAWIVIAGLLFALMVLSRPGH